MRVRSLLLPVLTCLLGAGLHVAPAYADAPTVTLSPVDLSRPGHVSGTAQTDAPYLKVLLRHAGYDVPGAVVVPVDPATGTASYDLESWGLDSAIVAAIPCTGATDADCTGPRTTNAQFTPADVAPAVTWSEGVVTPNDPLTVTTDDPDGGGDLVLVAQGCETLLPVERNATTTVDTEFCQDGTRTFELRRCFRGYPGWCTDTGVEHAAIVDRRLSVSWLRTAEDVSPDDTTAPDLTVALSVPTGTTYALEWRAVNPSTGEPSGVGGTMTGLAPDADGVLTLPLDLSPLADGRYRLAGRITADDSGTWNQLPWSGGFLVDATAPTATAAASWRTFFPDRSDRYRNAVTVALSDVVGNPYVRYLDVLDADGSLLRTLEGRLRWDGEVRGDLAPEGEYDLVVRLVDKIGNQRALPPIRVTLSRAKLVSRTWTHTVTARGSLVDTWTGRCSRIDRSVAGRPAGTVGLRSNATCRRDAWAGDGVVTVHGLRLPRAQVYDRAVVTARSGAAAGHVGSRAFLDHWRADERRWANYNLIGTRWGDHDAEQLYGVSRMTSGRNLYWRVGTADGAQYDVAGFTVSLRYRVLA